MEYLKAHYFFRNSKVLFSWFKTLFLSVLKISQSLKTSQTQTATAPAFSHEIHSSDALMTSDNSLNIQFYPSLISHLEMDHQHLLDLYTNIGSTLELKEFQLMSGQLNKFKDDFKAHLDTENIKFYGFLEQSLKGQNEQFTSLRRFRKEMRTIERTVIKFLDHWMEFGIDSNSYQDFKDQYETIGAALIKRIESEEKELYSMYSQI